MVNNVLPTLFAPAERDNLAQLQAQQQIVDVSPMIRTLLAAIPDIVLVLNKRRQIVFANDTCLKILGMNELSEVLGKRPGELLGCIHATETSGGCGTTEFCQTCGAAKAILTTLRGREDVEECRISLADGDALDLRVWTTPLAVDGQQFCVFSIKDISDEKRRSALERIFFHDVLNTAGVVTSCAWLIEDNPAETMDLIDELSRAAQRLVGEIQGQRQLLMAESGELSAAFEPVQLSEFLSEIGMEYTHHVLSNERFIRIDLPEQPVSLLTDPTLLGRVIGNMVKNALEACQPGDTVTASYTATADRVTFSVHNPMVMPREVQLQIFNRSFSTKGSGRGLGTYSMKMLSERYLHGRVRFTSAEGEGTTFYAEYPLS